MKPVIIFGVILGLCSLVNGMSTADKTDVLEIARQVADKYMAEQEGNEPTERVYGSRTAADSLSSFHRASMQRLQAMRDQERDMIEMRTLALLTSNGDEEIVRELEDLELFKRVDKHRFCDLKVNCSVHKLVVDGKEFRTSDGSCNNLDHFGWGMTEAEHWRLVDEAYDNDVWRPRTFSVNFTRRSSRTPLPGSLDISRTVHLALEGDITENPDVSLVLFQWGQFLDHDLIATPEGHIPSRRRKDCCKEKPNHRFCMTTTSKDGSCLQAARSDTVLPCKDTYQNQYNNVTSYIDASNVYGSSKEEADALRTFVGGNLKMQDQGMLPEADNGGDYACDENKIVNNHGFCGKAGDHRVNVQPGLATMHTLFMREHNRIAQILGRVNSTWSDERIYQEARKIVAAEMQRITYEEFLPMLLDRRKLSQFNVTTPYRYDRTTNATIFQAFAIAFRFHNIIPANLHMRSGNTNIVSHKLEDLFENPSLLFHSNYQGVEHLLNGLRGNSCPYATRFMPNATRDHLFGELDLAALNIERGREWGTPSYTVFRAEVCGLSNVTTWDNLTDHTPEVVRVLNKTYDDPRDIDLWTGCVSETPIGSSFAGPTQTCLVAKQFANLKHGDRFWYETSDPNTGFTNRQLREIRKVSLAKVICDNTHGIDDINERVFDLTSRKTLCEDLPSMDLSVWGD